jgi:hypothetical protein
MLRGATASRCNITSAKGESCYLLTGRLLLVHGRDPDHLSERVMTAGSVWRNRPGDVHTIEAWRTPTCSRSQLLILTMLSVSRTDMGARARADPEGGPHARVSPLSDGDAPARAFGGLGERTGASRIAEAQGERTRSCRGEPRRWRKCRCLASLTSSPAFMSHRGSADKRPSRRVEAGFAPLDAPGGLRPDRSHRRPAATRLVRCRSRAGYLTAGRSTSTPACRSFTTTGARSRTTATPTATGWNPGAPLAPRDWRESPT